MPRILTWFWSLLLGSAILALVVGFAGGRSLSAPSAHFRSHLAFAKPPPDVIPRKLDRQLIGAHSFDASEDDRDDFDRADDAVTRRPRGWAPLHFDPLRERARIALVVVDAGIAGESANAFIESDIPFALVVPAVGDDGGILRDAASHQKAVLIDARSATAVAIARARARGATGAIGEFSDRSRARSIVRAIGDGIAVDALLGDDATFYKAARSARAVALTRDVTVDMRDSTPYLDAMLGSALAIARRTGVAVVALHARPRTYAAIERFVRRARNDDVDIVPIDRLASAAPRTVAAQR